MQYWFPNTYLELSNILTKSYLFFEGTENDNVARVLPSSAVNNAVSQQYYS